MPGNVSSAFQGGADEQRRDFGFKRIVAAEEFDTERAFFQGFVDQVDHFLLGRVGILEGEGRRGELEDRHVNADAVFRNVVKNVLQRTGHIQASRDTVHCQHSRAEGRAPHFAEVNVAVNNAGLKSFAGKVDDFFSFFRDVALDFGNFAVLDGDIGNAVNRIQRIDDPSILEK